MTGTAEKLTVMLEGEAANLDKYLFLDGIEQGLVCCAKIAAQIESGDTISGKTLLLWRVCSLLVLAHWGLESLEEVIVQQYN